MIAFVRGRVAATGPDGAVVDVGGVGLALQCTPAALAGLRVGEEAEIPTSLVVREDALTLFGFADDDERATFEVLQTASGVGPRLALSMLAVHSPDALRRAVATEDVSALTKVPGIGKKGAQRIVLELKDRLGAPIAGDGETAPRGRPVAAPWRDQVVTGLINLGWSAKDAEAAAEAVAAELDGEQVPPVADLLKSALKKLAKP
ncbi:Holliday junction branch migration protein RuvA [Thermomonospora catenispora]|uniref:Holliday junction branch migration protein RuvA n=1 Tax=Thermomonospora catenispora TaxID=2493090 RepID=UPI001122D178|nr:Holliday junction branch migration protein RuvA [Thermomonospora catenispora]TNY35363.1 Holliday junction branch migration protein RuvA [Thermomonospora catenispora]